MSREKGERQMGGKRRKEKAERGGKEIGRVRRER